MTEPNVLDPILDLLRPGSAAGEETAHQHARNVQAGLKLIAQRLDDWDAAIDGWKEVWGYGNVSPLGTIFRAKKAGELVGINVPGPTIDDVVRMVRGSLEPVRANVRQASDLLRPYVDNPGRPEHILEVANAWSADVHSTISSLTEWFTEKTLLVDDAWSGPAARAYRDFLPGQRAAVGEVARRADAVKETLTGLGVALQAFWTDLDTSISSAVVELASKSLGLFDVDAVDKAGELVERLNDRIGDLVGKLRGAEAIYIEAASDLTTMTNDNTLFPSEQWPRPGALGGISADTSDWTPKPPESNQ
jgi:hypothetical protein